MLDLIHWEQGQFLRPQHLQQFQKSLSDGGMWLRRSLQPFPYGVLEFECAAESLQNFEVRFQRLRAIMPSGLDVWLGRNADLAPKDVSRWFRTGTRSLKLYLAVPNWTDTSPMALAETASVSDWPPLFGVYERQVKDENGATDPQPIRFRRIKARLLAEGEDDSNFEKIEILRLDSALVNKASVPKVNPDFFPPMLDLASNGALMNDLEGLVHSARSTRDRLARTVKQWKWSNGPQDLVHWVLRLRATALLVERIGPLLDAAREGGGIHPFMVFQELRSAVAEVLTLRLGEMPFVDVAYNHQDPLPSFNRLRSDLLDLLQAQEENRPMEIPMLQGAMANRFFADLPESAIVEADTWHLGIEGPGMNDAAADFVARNPIHFRLLTAAAVEANQNIPGFTLRPDQERRAFYNQVARGARIYRIATEENPGFWNEIKRTRRIGLVLSFLVGQPSAAFQGARYTLYATHPPKISPQ